MTPMCARIGSLPRSPRGDGSGKQRRTAIGELQIRSALVPPEPALRDGAFDSGPEVITAAASGQKRRVDALDVDAAILHRLDAVRYLDQLAGGSVGVGEGASLSRCNPPI